MMFSAKSAPVRNKGFSDSIQNGIFLCFSIINFSLVLTVHIVLSFLNWLFYLFRPEMQNNSFYPNGVGATIHPFFALKGTVHMSNATPSLRFKYEISKLQGVARTCDLLHLQYSI
jgi:hypothetical protein